MLPSLDSLTLPKLSTTGWSGLTEGLTPQYFAHLIMSKIETAMIHAVYNHKEWRSANTEVRINGPHAMVFLHGNHIATLNRFDKAIEFYSGPSTLWFSRTTFSRLNSLALQFAGFQPFYTRKNVPMISTRNGDREWQLRDFYSFNAAHC